MDPRNELTIILNKVKEKYTIEDFATFELWDREKINDFLKLCGIDPAATTKTIRNKLALILHPDKHTKPEDKQFAEELFKLFIEKLDFALMNNHVNSEERLMPHSTSVASALHAATEMAKTAEAPLPMWWAADKENSQGLISNEQMQAINVIKHLIAIFNSYLDVSSYPLMIEDGYTIGYGKVDAYTVTTTAAPEDMKLSISYNVRYRIEPPREQLDHWALGKKVSEENGVFDEFNKELEKYFSEKVAEKRMPRVTGYKTTVQHTLPREKESELEREIIPALKALEKKYIDLIAKALYQQAIDAEKTALHQLEGGSGKSNKAKPYDDAFKKATNKADNISEINIETFKKGISAMFEHYNKGGILGFFEKHYKNQAMEILQAINSSKTNDKNILARTINDTILKIFKVAEEKNTPIKMEQTFGQLCQKVQQLLGEWTQKELLPSAQRDQPQIERGKYSGPG